MQNGDRMTPPDIVLWDWDNTLADNWASMTAAMNVAFADFGLPAWSEAQMRNGAKLSIREAFPRLFGADWRRARMLFLTAFERVHLEGVRAMPGAAEALAAVWVPQGIVSNKVGEPLRREVAHMGWAGFFGPIIGADDLPESKPHPAPIRHALAVLGAKPGHCVWYVGDTGVDMQAAHAACCTAILIGDATHDGGLVSMAEQEWAPHLQLPDLFALTALLRRLAPPQ